MQLSLRHEPGNFLILRDFIPLLYKGKLSITKAICLFR